MSTTTYYIHVDHDGHPTGPRARYIGTEKYGYQRLAVAIYHCPNGASVVERHTDGCNDWEGLYIGGRGVDGVFVRG